jgi:hypothetical protein
MMSELLMMGGAAMMIWIIPAVLLPFLYLYLLQDLAGRREGTRDPNLGTQVMLTALMTVGVQLAVGGLAMIAGSIPAEHGDDIRKTGSGLLLGGLIAGAFPTYIYMTRVRAESVSRIGHKALGLNAAVFGLAFTAIATIVSIAMFHEEDIGEPIAVAIVYLAASVVSVLKLTNSPLPPAQARRPG